MQHYPINSRDILEFRDSGYLILKDAVRKSDLFSFSECLWHIIKIALKRFHVTMPRNLTSLSIKNKCDVGLIALRKANPDYPLFVQASISRSPEYYRLCSTPKIMNYMRQLLGENNKNELPLYLTNNGIIFTNPNDSENYRSSNIELEWHKDTFYTIPRSYFLHIWVPLLHDATQSIGTLEICPGSHKEGVGKQLMNPEAQYDHRYRVESSSVAQYKPKILEVKLGDALIFDSRLIHRSGKNTSQHVRCTLIGLHHAVSNPDFEPLAVSYGYRNQTPEAYYYEIFNDSKVIPFLDEQAVK